MLVPVILCGGSGTRLWPLSRKSLPKPYLPLLSDKSMLQETILRSQQLTDQPIIIVCNEAHRFLVAQQLLEMNIHSAHILLEPTGKNTAPAVALAAHYVEKTLALKPANLLVLPADHLLEIDLAFKQSVVLAEQLATQGELMTFGVTPTTPSTAYGYIQSASVIAPGAYRVMQFIEKPDLPKAKQLIAQQNCYWNSGMFVLNSATYLLELAQYEKSLSNDMQCIAKTFRKDLDFVRFDNQLFERLPAKSIDYAVMEHTPKAVVIPIETKWSDIGTWDAISALQPADENNNICHGNVMLEDSSNCYVQANHRLIAAIGLHNQIIIETKDAILVADKSRCQAVQTIVAKLKAQNIAQATEHSLVCRPWGQFEIIDESDGFKVKRIVVNQGATLSMQKHMHRSEHWVVVKGTAEVTCDDKVFLLYENQSTYIPQTARHRLKNVGKISLEIIEIQVGRYLGEDDIERFDDVYGRVTQTVSAC
ncbi:MAG: mannose-1-phosphate guanylyltransferase/mannose-6-phosphate isomerase [Gammaproteobacteria bacterium RIFCSPHIGHO2_12_FULL_41_15]|nr:MAG: mannose-1-phosphate guanylyltransferase/mannose-6-phosphate isomerase [Gammaproteobacteria bacterium RIFCSPHIGHO2_12_FULL_41_15]